MAQRIIKGTLNTFSIASVSQLAFLENAEVRVAEDQADGAGVFYAGGNAQGLKRTLEVRASLFSDISTALRASHLDLTAADFGATDLLVEGTENVTLNVDVEHRDKPGAGELWAYPVPSNRVISASGSIGIQTANSPGLLVAMGSNTYADLNLAFSMTLGGVTFDVPLRLSETAFSLDNGGILTHSFSASDRSGRSGVTITPSGTTTFIEKILNAWQTAIGFSFSPSAAPSVSYGGNMVFKSMQLSVADKQLVPTQFTWMSQGAVTVAATS